MFCRCIKTAFRGAAQFYRLRLRRRVSASPPQAPARRNTGSAVGAGSPMSGTARLVLTNWSEAAPVNSTAPLSPLRLLVVTGQELRITGVIERIELVG